MHACAAWHVHDTMPYPPLHVGQKKITELKGTTSITHYFEASGGVSRTTAAVLALPHACMPALPLTTARRAFMLLHRERCRASACPRQHRLQRWKRSSRP